MVVQGNFLRFLADAAKKGWLFGVMVIDEADSFGDHGLLKRQVNVLNIATKMGWPTWFITLNDIPLHKLLRATAPKAVTYTKPRGDAFEATAVCEAVKKSGVNRIVMMGHAGGQCVKLSAVGGRWKPSDEPTPGATGNGYRVYTCQAIISGDVKDWKNHVGVRFFDSYLPPKPTSPAPK
jgi:nicotinamidase-related amidase